MNVERTVVISARLDAFILTKIPFVPDNGTGKVGLHRQISIIILFHLS